MLCCHVEYKECHSDVGLNLRYWLVQCNHSKLDFFLEIRNTSHLRPRFRETRADYVT